MFYKTVLMCFSLVSAAFPYSSLAKASNCVYWKVQKSQFFFMDEDVTGKSCEVSLGLVRTSKNTISVGVEVPIVSFDSGIEARDEDVFSILGGNLQPNIAVETSQMSKEDLRKTVAGSQKSIIGVLQLAGKGYPVEIVLEKRVGGILKQPLQILEWSRQVFS